MKTFVVTAIALSVLALGSVRAARADDACTAPKTTYDKTYCVSKLFLESDKELNQVYKDLAGILKPEQKKKLTVAQRAWIKFRDGACEASGTIDVDCNFKVNKERGDSLRDRLRECKTGQCRDDLMYQTDFKKPAPAAG